MSSGHNSPKTASPRSPQSQGGDGKQSNQSPSVHEPSPPAEGNAPIPFNADDLEEADEGFGDGSSTATSTASLTDSILEYRLLHGRTFQQSKTTEYWGPNDDRQNDGLDIAHHYITRLLDDQLYKAPIGTPSKVLDIGTGTGIWAIDMADTFPSAEVIGFDISPIQPAWVPPNCQFHIDDAQLNWTWTPESFDFVHIRMLYGSIDDWTRLYSQAYKALVPGGYLEDFELNIELQSDVPEVRDDPNHVFKQWAGVFFQAFDRLGKTARIGLDGRMRRYMQDAGFEDIWEEIFYLPCGGWSSDPRLKEIGYYNLAFMEESLEGFALFLLKEIMGWEYTEIQVLVANMRRACRDPKIRPYTVVPNVASSLVLWYYYVDIDISFLKAPVRDGHEVDLKVYACREKSGKGDATLILRMHGGGWTIGKHETEEAENRVLAGMKNFVLVSVDYRMAPEFAYPIPLNDCFDVFKWCQTNSETLGINPQKIILTGCSAGGNLAAALCILARDEGLTGIIGQHLSIPPFCHPKLFKQLSAKFELLSYVQNNEYIMLSAGEMESAWDFYTGFGEPEADPLHSPLVATNLSNLPPALLHIAGRDPLRDEGIAYAEKLKEAGNEVELVVLKDIGHGFYTFTQIKETWEYFDRVKAWMKKVSDSK